MIRNWCCSFDMFSYETVVWLPSLSCAMALKLTSKGLETFSSCLLSTCETAYYTMVAAVKREHHLPGQCSLSAHWTAQNRHFDQRLGRRISRQWIRSKATFDCSSSSQVWVCKRLILASVVQHHRLSWRNRPAQYFAATLQNFSYNQVCRPHTMRVQAQGEQLHQAHLVIPCTVMYPHISASDSILLLWPVTTTTYCVPVHRRFAVFLCVPPQNRCFAGFSEWLMNADAEAKQWLSWTFIPISFLMYMHHCRLCILNLCECCMCCTHYYWHTQTHKWTNTSPLSYSPPCTNPDSDTTITVALFPRSHAITWHSHASPKWTGHQKIMRRPCSYSNKLHVCHTTVKMRTSQIQAK